MHIMQVDGQTRRDLAGIGWMLVTGLCFVAVNGIVRWLDGALPAPQAAFIRFVFGLIFLAPLLVGAQVGEADVLPGVAADLVPGLRHGPQIGRGEEAAPAEPAAVDVERPPQPAGAELSSGGQAVRGEPPWIDRDGGHQRLAIASSAPPSAGARCSA